MRQVDGDKQTGICRCGFEAGRDSGQRAQARQTVGQGVAAYDVYRVCRLTQQVDHMIKERMTVPLQQGLIAAHSSAFAAGEDKTAHRHGVDSNCAVPLI